MKNFIDYVKEFIKHDFIFYMAICIFMAYGDKIVHSIVEWYMQVTVELPNIVRCIIPPGLFIILMLATVGIDGVIQEKDKKKGN